MLTGTLFNSFAIVLGSLIGLKLGHKLSDKVQQTLFSVAGLTVLVIGMQMALKVNDAIGLITCLMFGAIVGEWIDIESALEKLASRFKSKMHTNSSNFADGFVTATLTFCVGSMAIVGAIEEGLNNNTDILMAKGVIDGICAVLFAASLGFGVIFSAIAVLLYQGIITLSASSISSLLTESTISLLSAVGGVLIVALGLRLLEIKKIRVANLLPALLMVIFWSLGKGFHFS